MGAAFGGGEKDACVKQAGQDGVQVIVKPMPCTDRGADLIQPQFIVDILEEEVPAVELSLVLQFKVSAGAEGDMEGRGLPLFRFVHEADLLFCPCLCICNAIGFAYVFIRAKSLDDHGLVLPVHPDCLDGPVCYGVFVFCPSKSHKCHLTPIIQYL